MLAAAVATGVAATGVCYFTEAFGPAAESIPVAPLVTSIPAPAALPNVAITPNPLLDAVTRGAVSSTSVAAQSDLPLIGPIGQPAPVAHAALSSPAVPVRVASERVGRHRAPEPAVVGNGAAASFTTAALPAVNPLGILQAAFAVFVSNGDQPGDNGGLLIGNGAD